MKDAIITARIDKDIKEKAEKILSDLGLSASKAIGIFYEQIVSNNDIPFEVKIPNKKTLKAMHDADTGNNLHTADSIEEMFKELNS